MRNARKDRYARRAQGNLWRRGRRLTPEPIGVSQGIAALHTGIDVQGYVARQRAAHLRRMRELGQVPPGAGPAERLVREHLVAHLDADLRWLDLATELLRTPAGTPHDPVAAASTPPEGPPPAAFPVTPERTSS